MAYSKENLKVRYVDCSTSLQNLIDSFITQDTFNGLKPQVATLQGKLTNVIRISSGATTPTTNIYNDKNIHIDEQNKLIKWYHNNQWVGMCAVLG